MEKQMIQIGPHHYEMDTPFLHGMSDARASFYEADMDAGETAQYSGHGERDQYRRGYKLQKMLLLIEIGK